MSEQELVDTGPESGSPARDDLGQLTDEALLEQMYEREEPSPVDEEGSETVAEGEYDEEEEEADTTLSEDDQSDDSEEVEEDDEDVEYADDDSGKEPQTFAVKIDGKEVTVDLEELKRGYSGQSFINQSMQKVAHHRKETEQLFAQLSHERGQIQQAFQMLQSGALSTPPVAPEEALFNSDPMSYMEQKLAYDQQANEYQHKLNYLQQQVQENQEVQTHAKQVYLAREAELLQGYAPELFDESTGQGAKENLVATAAEAYGFAPEELAMLMDHRHVRVLMDAVKYNNLNSASGKKKVEQKVKNGVVRGKKRKVSAAQASRKKMKQKLRESGSIEDAMGLILE